MLHMMSLLLQASKNKQEVSFYSIPEFEEWKKHTDNYKTWHIKYYKGLCSLPSLFERYRV